MITILEVILFIGLIILFVCFLKKFNYDFKGIELIIFWILFTIFTYIYLGNSLIEPILFLGIYYLIRLIKTQKYINWYLIVIQFLLIFPYTYIFGLYEDKVCEGWCAGGLIIALYLIIIVGYMLLINLITLIVKSIPQNIKDNILSTETKNKSMNIIKKLKLTLFYFLIINACIFILHIFAFFGVAFNDTGITYDRFIDLLPTLSTVLIPMIIASIILIRVISKKGKVYKSIIYILQALIVIWWIYFYVYNYMPNSFIRQYEKNSYIVENQQIQNDTNIYAQNSLSTNNYIEIENINENNKNIIIYINKKNTECIIKYTNEDKEYFSVTKLSKVNINNINVNTKYNKNNNYIAIKDYDNNFIVCINNNCYRTEKEKLYYFSTRKEYIDTIYFDMLKNNVLDNKNQYIPNDIVILEIEKNNNIISITEESLKQVEINYEERFFDYGWVIKRDGVQILGRAIHPDDLDLNLLDLKEEFYVPKGEYEIYLNIYNDTTKSYIKASNSITWTN